MICAKCGSEKNLVENYLVCNCGRERALYHVAGCGNPMDRSMGLYQAACVHCGVTAALIDDLQREGIASWERAESVAA